MQAALDSTSLMLSKEASTDTATQLQTNAQNYFLALFTRTEAKNITVTANFTSGSTAMIVTANAEVPTTLLGIIGIDKINLTTSSTSKWGETRLRVALVLDNTGSMADAGKMAALQTATNSLADSIEECCHHQWRRLCLDRSVRKGRQSRRRQLEFGLHLLGHQGARSDAIRQQFLGCQQRNLQRRELLDPEHVPPAKVLFDLRVTPAKAVAPARAPARCRAITARAVAPAQALARSRAIPARAPARLREPARIPAKRPRAVVPATKPAPILIHVEFPVHVAWRNLG